MNGSISMIKKWIEGVHLSIPSNVQSNCVFCPPACYLPLASDLIKKKKLKISIGAQDLDPDCGISLTGGICASMLKELGCKYVIVGHSERRIHFQEDDSLLLQKLKAVSSGNLTAIFCIGETLEEKEAGKTFDLLKQQLEVIFKATPKSFLIAYEPIWAIGTGKTANTAYIGEVHSKIKEDVESMGYKGFLGVAYGGSVNSSSAKGILSTRDVDGLLIGGGSIEEKDFTNIALS